MATKRRKPATRRKTARPRRMNAARTTTRARRRGRRMNAAKVSAKDAVMDVGGVALGIGLGLAADMALATQVPNALARNGGKLVLGVLGIMYGGEGVRSVAAGFGGSGGAMLLMEGAKEVGLLPAGNIATLNSSRNKAELKRIADSVRRAAGRRGMNGQPNTLNAGSGQPGTLVGMMDMDGSYIE